MSFDLDVTKLSLWIIFNSKSILYKLLFLRISYAIKIIFSWNYMLPYLCVYHFQLLLFMTTDTLASSMAGIELAEVNHLIGI